MKVRCSYLDPFFDGELTADEADLFRDHLVTCARCQAALHGRVQESMLLPLEADRPSVPRLPPRAPVPLAIAAEGTAPAETPKVAAQEAEAKPDPATKTEAAVLPLALVLERARRRSSWPSLAGVAGIAATAAIYLAVATPGGPASLDAVAVAGPTGDVAIAAELVRALQPERRVEVRWSDPALDGYRRFAVVRAAGPMEPERIPLATLSRLEGRRGNAFVGARALSGELRSAEADAHTLPATARTLTDRAAIEYLEAAQQPTRAEQEAGLQRALALAATALRLDPGLAQAAWNQALALRELDLPLVAARAFGELADRREPGWADEARSNQRRMQDERAAWQRWNDRKRDARAMALGGPVPAAYAAADPRDRIPADLMRDELYLAIATAATGDRLDALAPAARALDDRFATRGLVELIARVRRSNLAARAPLAAALTAALRGEDAAALAEVRTRAIAAGAPDIALATFVVLRPKKLIATDVAQLDALVETQPDPWWRLVQLERHAYVDEYLARDYAAIDADARRAAPICATLRAASCGRIIRNAGAAAGEMGRIDDALRQLGEARQYARDLGMLDDEVAAIYATGQLMSARVTDSIDSAAIADAYLEEAEQRWGACDIRLQHLDFAASAALRDHRFDDARAARARADELEREACAGASLRFNGETVRAQLALDRPDAEPRARLRARLAQLRHDATPNYGLWLAYLEAVESLLDTSDGSALRQVIRAASDAPSKPFAPMVRGLAFDALIDAAARAKDGDQVLALLAEWLHVSDDPSCVVGVSAWNRLVVAVRGARGEVALDSRSQANERVPAAGVVSRALRDRLAGCPRVLVLTRGPYFGAPGLLDDTLAWAYRTGGAPLADRGLPPHELVISDVVSPAQMRLPVLRSFAAAPGGELLQGMAATPERVVDRMTDASLIVVVAHGFTDVNEPSAASLVLSPGATGDYLLTAPKVQAATLRNAPTVVLAGCDAGRVQVTTEPWSLATSFLRAGARTVIAPTALIPDDSANAVFRSLVDRLRAGDDAIDVLAAERRNRGPSTAWLSSIVVFVR